MSSFEWQPVRLYLWPATPQYCYACSVSYSSAKQAQKYQFRAAELCTHFLKGFVRSHKVDLVQITTKLAYLRYLLVFSFALYSGQW